MRDDHRKTVAVQEEGDGHRRGHVGVGRCGKLVGLESECLLLSLRKLPHVKGMRPLAEHRSVVDQLKIHKVQHISFTPLEVWLLASIGR